MNPFLTSGATGLTGPDGDCFLTDLTPGAVTIAFDRAPSRNVVLHAGATHSELVYLQRTPELRCKVVDPAGRAVPGAEVWISEGVGMLGGLRNTTETALTSSLDALRLGPVIQLESGRASIGWSLVTMRGEVVAETDVLGEFTLRGIPEGRLLGIRARDFEPSDLQVIVHDELQGAEIVLQPGAGGVRGNVSLPDGTPAVGAAVFVGNPLAGQPWRRVRGQIVPSPRPRASTTDSDGGFYVFGLRPGRTRVHAFDGDGNAGTAHVEVVAGRDAEVELPLEARASVVGTVRNAEGEVVAGALIEALAPYSHWVRSDAQGRFRLQGVLPAFEALLKAVHESEGTASELVAIDSLDVEWSPVLRRGSTLEGTVVVAPGHEVEGGFVVWAQPLEDPGWWTEPDGSRWQAGTAITDADGSFVIRHCHPGPHRVEIRREAAPGRLVLCAEIARAVPGEPLHVEVHPETLYLTALRIEVVDEEGGPVSGARVELLEIAGVRRGDRPNMSRVRVIECGPDGVATLAASSLRLLSAAVLAEGFEILELEVDLRHPLPPPSVTDLGKVALRRE